MNNTNKFSARLRRLSAGLLGSAITFAGSSLHAQSSKPNFVIILVDDMGYSDPGCYGGEIRTPNIDALAANGLRYTAFYNSTKCNTSRDAIITGTYPGKSGPSGGNGPVGHNLNTGWDASDHVVTIPEVLKPAGYRTYHSGKWHAQNAGGLDTFDVSYGLPAATNFYDPDGKNLPPLPSGAPNPYHMTDATTDEALSQLADHRASHSDKPFFLNLCYNAPHWPLHASPERIQEYDDSECIRQGLGLLREERYARMVELGVIDNAANWPDPGPQRKALVKNTDPCRSISKRSSSTRTRHRQARQSADPFPEWFVRRMEVHAAMVTHLDEGIGMVVQKLKDYGYYDNTVIVFLSDNGCSPENHAFVPSENRQNTRDGSPIFFGSYSWLMPGPENTRQTVGIEWSTASNTPFRVGKVRHWTEGSCTPFIVSWPNGIAASENGTFRRQLGHLIDLMPTFAELGGATYPIPFNGNSIIPSDGISLVPSFANQPLERDALTMTYAIKIPRGDH